jgi:transcription elongation factor Elf1
MSIFVDVKFLNMLSNRLLLFKQKQEFLWNFRCPICGDSQKKLTKARGYVHRKKNDLFFKCHNCGVGLTFSNFLKQIDTTLHAEYIMERYKNGENGHSNYKKPTFHFETPKFKKEAKLDLAIPCLTELNDEHLCVKYVQSRLIKSENYKYLYFAQDFKEWVESLNLDHSFELIDNDPRLVIPFIDEQGNLIAAQGRSLDKKSKLRYITIKVIEDAPKIFGLNTLDRSKTAYVVEGPIDSLFVENAIAMAGADLSTSMRFLNDVDLVFVYDNEKRNREIVKKMENIISQNHKIVIWPNTIPFKDINDMVLNDIDVMKILEDNTYKGLQAKMKLVEFKV